MSIDLNDIFIINDAMYPSKRSSVSSNKQNSVASIDLQPNLNCERIQRYIQFIKLSLRSHLKEKQYQYEETQLKQLHKLIKNIQQYYLKTQKDSEATAKTLKEELERERQLREEIIGQLKSEAEERALQIQRQQNQKILAINNEFGRKQQKYKQVIQKLINSLNGAQKIQQNNQSKLQIATKCLQKIVDSRLNNQNITKGIKQMVEQIQLRQQNSKISSKSDEMSIDEIVISGKKLGVNLIQDSEHYQDAVYTPAEKKIQSWLMKLICYGLFQKKNQECIKKIITFTANYQHPAQILKQNVFPLISEVLVNNMKHNHEDAIRFIEGTTSILEDNEEQSHVELRNINHLSELSINDSQMEDLNFKKRDHF